MNKIQPLYQVSFEGIISDLIIRLKEKGFVDLSLYQLEYIRAYVTMATRSNKQIIDIESYLTKIIGDFSTMFKKPETAIEDISLFLGADPTYKRDIIYMSSLYRDPTTYNTPSKFRINFLKTQGVKYNYGYVDKLNSLRGVVSLKLLNAIVPNFKISLPTSEHLFIKFDEFTGNLYTTQNTDPMFADLTFENSAGGPYLKLDKSHERFQKFVNSKQLQSLNALTVTVNNEYGNIYTSASPDPVSITGFSNANPTVITTAINHGLLVNDKIFIRNFNNGYILGTSYNETISRSVGLNDTINRYTGWKVTNILSPTTFNIALDLSFQFPNQADSELGINPAIPSPKLYPLGSFSYVLVEKFQFTFVLEALSMYKL